MPSKFLITGATGFLGRHLLHVLLQHKDIETIIVLVRDVALWNSYTWTRSLDRVIVLQGDITHPEAWQNAPILQDLTGIFHLAAVVQHSRAHACEVLQAGAQGTLAIAHVAAKYAARMVFVSSSGTVGCSKNAADAPDEDALYSDIAKNWPYYASKIAAEQAVRAFASHARLQLIIIRPPVLLGPHDHRLRSTSHIARFLQGRLPFVLSGGMHYIDVRDAAVAIAAAMLHPSPRPIYHLVGIACSIKQFFNDVARIAHKKPPRFVLPYSVAYALARLNASLHQHFLPDPVVIEMGAHHWNISSKYAAEDLHFKPRPKDETLQDTIHGLQLL